MALLHEALLFIKIVTSLVMGTLTLSLIKQFYCSNRESPQTSAYRWLQLSALGGLMGFFIAYLFHAIAFIIEIATDSLYANQAFSATDFIFFNLSYTMSWSSFYIFMLLRIKYTFMNSVYELDNKLLYVHSVIAILAPLLVIIAIFDIKAFQICSGIFVGFTAISASHLIYTFNHNLWNLIISQEDNENTHTSQSKKNQDIDDDVNKNFNAAQRNMVKTVVKHTVLGVTILISLAICAYIVTLGGLIESDATRIVLVYIGGILIICCGICLYCSFTSNNELYQKLCIKCDRCTLKWYSNLAKNRREEMEKEMNTIIEYEHFCIIPSIHDFSIWSVFC